MKKSLKIVTVSHTAWFLFCPVYLEKGFEEDGGLCPYPRGIFGFLLSPAFWIFQLINWLVSLTDPEA